MLLSHIDPMFPSKNNCVENYINLIHSYPWHRTEYLTQKIRERWYKKHISSVLW